MSNAAKTEGIHRKGKLKTHKLSQEGFASPWLKRSLIYKSNTTFLTNILKSFLDLCYLF